MSDISQITGVALIFLLMALALYAIDEKKDFKKGIWCMVAALIISQAIF